MRISETIMNETPNYSDPPRLGLRKLMKSIIESKCYHIFYVLMIFFNLSKIHYYNIYLVILTMYYRKAPINYFILLNYC